MEDEQPDWSDLRHERDENMEDEQPDWSDLQDEWDEWEKDRLAEDHLAAEADESYRECEEQEDEFFYDPDRDNPPW